MSSIDLSPLFQPFRIRGLNLKNRFVMPGMQTRAAPGGEPTAETAEYFRQRVAGGTALIISGSAAVDHPSATWQKGAAQLNRSTIGGWRRCADAVGGAGGVFLAQIFHEGAIRKAGISGPCPEAPSLSPSGLYRSGGHNGRAATAAELEELRDAFAHSARIAVEAGAHGVELHCAHGYLLDQFLWADTNLRDDGYGGPLIADRVRFPAQIIAAVRDAIGPQAILSVRFSQWKEIDYDAKIVHNPDELRILVNAFEQAGADMLHVSTRRFFLPEWPGSELGLAGWVKSMTDLPVITVGSVGLNVDLMESFFGQEESRLVIENNLDRLLGRFLDREFDLVAVGRSNIADARWVEKIRAGRYADIRAFSKADLAVLMEQDWDPGFIGEAHA